jgi:hypothetical protein
MNPHPTVVVGERISKKTKKANMAAPIIIRS